MPSTLIAAFVAVLVGLAAIAVLADSDSGEQSPRARHETAPVQVIARRVEALRGLRFRSPPRIRRVTPKETRKAGLADLDRSYPEAERRADETALKLLGLLEPADNLREAAGSIFGEQVAGFYDPRTKRLALVEGASGGGPVLDEITVAHELTHALEDARFDLDDDRLEGSGDASLAYLALVEGTATALMYEYADRHLDAAETLGELLSAALAQGGDVTGGLPPFLLAQLLFPYTEGRAFAEELYNRAGGWSLLDNAARVRPPASTEQVLHPDKWLRVEQPDRVRLDGLSDALGRGWKRLDADVLGEWATGEWLGGGAGARRAAAGWGGDRYELWRRGSDHALVLRWRWDSGADLREFVSAARTRVPRRTGALSVAASRREATVAFASDAALARRLAAATPR